MFDSHCHIDFPDFDADRTRVLARARTNGVKGFIIPATHLSAFGKLLTICDTADDLFPALGLHPYFLEQHHPTDIKTLRERAKLHHLIAIGEIGLDFQFKELDQQQQLFYFEQQLKVARDFDLPIILHNRKAHEPTLKMLKKYGVDKGIYHAFNGSMEIAEQYLKHNFKLGFGGMLTFDRSKKLRHLAAELPETAIVLETDAPDMPVASQQYKRNSPEYLPEILQTLAEIRCQCPDDLARITTDNLANVLNIYH